MFDAGKCVGVRGCALGLLPALLPEPCPHTASAPHVVTRAAVRLLSTASAGPRGM